MAATVATPVISPGTKSSATSIPVTITCASGAKCYYTNVAGTTGSAPSPTNGTQFTTSTSFTVLVSSVVEAMATETGYTSSVAATATYTIPLSVTVSPATVGVGAGGTQQFTATVVGSTNTVVNWSLSPATGAGTINTTSGLYTAPSTVTTPQTVTITATSQANTSVKGTATLTLKATPTLTFTTIPAKTYGVAPFTVSASSASSGAITYSVTSGPATISGSTVTITGVGAVVLGASQASTTTYTAATASTSFSVSAATPTVTVTSTSGTYGTPLTLAATSTYLKSGVATATGQTISYALVSGPATLSNGVLTFTGVGSVVVTASVSATGNFGTGTSPQAPITVALGTPVITFTSSNTVAFGTTLTVAATSTLGTPTFTETNGTGTGTLSGSTLTPTGIGSVTITASVTATANYKSATATQAVSITVATPTVTVISTSGTFGVPLTLTATSTYLKNGVAIATGQTISYTLVSGPATLSSGVLTFTGISSVSVKASVSATGNFGAGTVTQTINVSAATPTVTVTSTTGNYGTPLTLTATSTYLKNGVTTATGQTISYALVSGPATLSNGVLTFTGVGSVVVTASVSATGNFGAAISPQTPITVVMATPTPTFSPAAGPYPTAQYVTISDSDPNGAIYYTTDGKTQPTTASYEYGGPIQVYMNEKLMAIAVDSNYANSAVATAAYTIQAAPPTLSLPSGSYVGSQTVTITDATSSNAKIYYTTNGTSATTGSTPYPSAGITVSASETINAVATVPGYATSPDVSAAYTITSAPVVPTFSPAAGSYTGAQLVTINNTSLNATVYYTIKSGTAGTTPTTASTVYTGGAITVSSTETLEAIAVTPGYSNSTPAIATYTLSPTTSSTTTLAITSSGTPVTSVASNSVVTLTATVVSGTKAVTTGMVNFCDVTLPNSNCTDIHLLGTAQLTKAGTAVISFRPGVLPGITTRSYKAVFVGTSSYSTSAGTGQLTVTGTYQTTTTIGVTGAAGSYSAKATVSAAGNITTSPIGSVSLLDTSNGNAVLGTASLPIGSATIAFPVISTTATGNDPSFVGEGDFNNDGFPDLAVINSNDNTLTILLNSGSGTFTAQIGGPIVVGNGPTTIAVGDFDGDGILDSYRFIHK